MQLEVVPNANGSSITAAPFKGTAEEHTARVLGYFEDECGLPKEQVGETHVTTMVRGSGSVSDMMAGKRDGGALVAYATVLDRVVDGIPVRGSYAWARFNGNDDVISEEVYWPELSQELVQQAQALKEQLAESAQAAAFQSHLPAELRGQQTEVAIFHSPFYQEAFESGAAIGFSAVSPERRFLIDGTEVRFGYEKVADQASQSRGAAP